MKQTHSERKTYAPRNSVTLRMYEERYGPAVKHSGFEESIEIESKRNQEGNCMKRARERSGNCQHLVGDPRVRGEAEASIGAASHTGDRGPCCIVIRSTLTFSDISAILSLLHFGQLQQACT